METVSDYNRLIQREGVRTSLCANRFEIIANEGSDVWEQQSVQLLREWIEWRKSQERLRDTGRVSK